MPLIAILDDRMTNRNIYAKLARSLADRIEVASFDNPLTALHWLAGHDADLVITDYKMPDLDGAAFTARLRALPNGRDVPVVVITAYDDRSYRLLALQAGATDFLQSPVDHAEFITRGRNLLRMHDQHRFIQARARDLERELEISLLSREKLVRDNAEALAQVIDTVPAFISAADASGRVVFVNAMQAEIGHGAGTSSDPAFGPAYERRSLSLDQLVFRSGKPIPSFEQEIVDRSGQRRVLLTTKSPLRDSGGAIGSVLTTSLDITSRKDAERHLRHVASHDGLTDLPNRQMLQERLGALLGRAGRNGPMVALHFLDLDRFKAVNDQFGHHRGDTVLRTVADHLRSCVGPLDMVARIGGDEFAVLQAPLADRTEASRLAGRIIERIGRPIAMDGQEISVSGSIGITLAPADGIDPAQMLRNADMAMYQAKSEGRESYRFFVPDMNERIGQALRLKRELRHALSTDALALFYQPQLNLRTGQVQGVEALLRWNHPSRGLVLPGEFLPFAEEDGTIVEIDDWVLHRACRDAARWQRQGLGGVRVGVNISPLRIATARVQDTIRTALDRTGLDPSLLEIELTERDLVDDLAETATGLRALRETGVQIAIDDFGIGYSFLGHVKTFPADRLKIDQSFVRTMLSNDSDATIVRSIIGLAHGLRMGVVAEGVETVEQLTHLAAEGCDLIQGYYIGHPMTLAALLERHDTDPAQRA